MGYSDKSEQDYAASLLRKAEARERRRAGQAQWQRKKDRLTRLRKRIAAGTQVNGPAAPPTPTLNSVNPSPPSISPTPAPNFSNFSAPSQTVNQRDKLINIISTYTANPLGFVDFNFTWGEGEFEGMEGPFAWQREILGIIGAHLSSPETHYQPLKIAVASGKGIGKSALVSMISKWGMDTCDDARVVLTAANKPQLYSKTWPEVHKWFRSALTADWFNLGAESITARDPRHERTWRMDALAWSKENPQAFAGLHNKRKRIVVIFDEASEIADVIWDQTEGALTDEKTEIIWLAFGNPFRNTGRFADCFGKFKHRWVTRQIDARTVEGINQETFKQWADDYGEDSDHVRVWVRGVFPRSDISQLIPSEYVERAQQYKAEGFTVMPKIIGVDVARYGKNKTVIGLRQGRKYRVLGKFRGLDIVQTAEKVIHFIVEEEPDLIVVDGDGLGAGVVDVVRNRGFGKGLHEFHGGFKADDTEAYFNRRAECWGKTRDWLREGAEIPRDLELATDLVSPQYGYSGKGQQIQLEKKEDMEKRGIPSPDDGDALAMTFDVEVRAKRVERKTTTYVYPQRESQSWMQ